MSTNPNLNNDPELLKIKTKDAEVKDLNNKNEKLDHENIIKSLESHNEYYKKKYKSINKNKVLLKNTETEIGSASTISYSTMRLINPGAGSISSIILSSTALLTSFAILITKNTSLMNEK